MTFVIVGAGPTGVELAGTIAELARTTFLLPTFGNIDTRRARIVLIEAGPRALPAFRQELSDYAKRSLEALGVEVELGQAVTECSGEGVVYGRQDPCRGDVYLGGGRAGVAGRAMARCAGRSGRTARGRAGPHRPGTPGDFRHRRRRPRLAAHGRPVPASRRPPSRKAPMSRK